MRQVGSEARIGGVAGRRMMRDGILTMNSSSEAMTPFQPDYYHAASNNFLDNDYKGG